MLGGCLLTYGLCLTGAPPCVCVTPKPVLVHALACSSTCWCLQWLSIKLKFSLMSFKYVLYYFIYLIIYLINELWLCHQSDSWIDDRLSTSMLWQVLMIIWSSVACWLTADLWFVSHWCSSLCLCDTKVCTGACSSISCCLQWSSGSSARLWLIYCLYIHLSVLSCLAKWINDVNCLQLWSSYWVW
jgi:hypothetical protein